MPKRRISKADWNSAADYVRDEHRRRQNLPCRIDLERQWAEIDRQLAMKPAPREMPRDPNERQGVIWRTNLELPWQAQTLETLVADARRMQGLDARWFSAHVKMDDDNLAILESNSLLAGSENDLPSEINQDNLDRLAEGLLRSFHRAYDFPGNMSIFNAEAFKYGTAIGRVEIQSQEAHQDQADGAHVRTTRFPMFWPKSIRTRWLDDAPYKAYHEGMVLSPSIIGCWRHRLADLMKAAAAGSSDPDVPNGGWMKAMVRKLEASQDGRVEIVEYEGDLVVDRSTTEPLYWANCRVWVATGSGKENGVIRFRLSPWPFLPYLTQTYHVEEPDIPYGVSPLMKGRPLQNAASTAFCALTDWANLNTEPPVTWDATDPTLKANGGPIIAPRRLWANTVGSAPPAPVAIGDGTALMQLMVFLQGAYFDVTGVNPPRLGAQTVSHTTAYAKDVELTRGTVRTVEYVRATTASLLPRLLQMEMFMARQELNRGHEFYVPEYHAHVKLPKDGIPKDVEFEVFGAGGPAEAAERQTRRERAVQLAAQIDQLKLQIAAQFNIPVGAPLDYSALQKEIIGAEFPDLDVIFLDEQPTGAPAATPAAAPGGPQLPGLITGRTPA